MKGRDSWSERPRDIKTIRVSQLSEELRADFKNWIGKRRWTTEYEIERLVALKKIKFKSEKGEPERVPSQRILNRGDKF